MRKIKVNFPKKFPRYDYYGLINGGTYTIDPTYKSKSEYRTMERLNMGLGVYVLKDWCTILPDIDLELPEDLF